MLAEIYGWFTKGFDTKDLQGAKALLVQLDRRCQQPWGVNQTTEDWHTRLVTLSATKGLSERCFAEFILYEMAKNCLCGVECFDFPSEGRYLGCQ